MTAEQELADPFGAVEVGEHQDAEQLGAGVSPAEVRWLERLAGMDTPPQEQLGFLGG